MYLDSVTRLDAASDFFGEAHVPRRALTMGVATIMQVAGPAGGRTRCSCGCCHRHAL